MSAPSGDSPVEKAWAGRAAEESPRAKRAKARSVERATQIVAAAHRLVDAKGADFTTVELAKEAGLAIQTFYTYFKGKDEVLLAVIEDMITGACDDLRERGRDIQDPVERLRFYVGGFFEPAQVQGIASPSARFVTTEHWRLQQVHPAELEAATRHVTDLFIEALQEATDDGLLAPADVRYDAWLATQMIMAVYHHHAFAVPDRPLSEIADSIWTFCSAAWAGPVRPAASPALSLFRRARGTG